MIMMMDHQKSWKSAVIAWRRYTRPNHAEPIYWVYEHRLPLVTPYRPSRGKSGAIAAHLSRHALTENLRRECRNIRTRLRDRASFSGACGFDRGVAHSSLNSPPFLTHRVLTHRAACSQKNLHAGEPRHNSACSCLKKIHAEQFVAVGIKFG
jgi:hypothetical protein